MTNIGFEKKLREHKWAVALLVGSLLAALALGLALMAGPAGALPGDCSEPTDCDGGGDTNSPPTVGPASGRVEVPEGQQADYNGTFSDLDGNPVTISVASGPGSVVQNPAGGDAGTWSWSFDTTDGPDQSQTVTITATDSAGATATTTFSLTVNNVAPTVTPSSNNNNVVEYPYLYRYDFSVSDPGNDTWSMQATSCGPNGVHWEPSVASPGGGVDNRLV